MLDFRNSHAQHDPQIHSYCHHHPFPDSLPQVHILHLRPPPSFGLHDFRAGSLTAILQWGIVCRRNGHHRHRSICPCLPLFRYLLQHRWSQPPHPHQCVDGSVIDGQCVGLLFSLLVVYGMGWSWMANLLVYALVYLALSVGFQLVMDEVQMERQMDSPLEALAAVKRHYTRQTSN